MGKDDGFLVAVFPDGRREQTEVANAVLAAKAKACKGKPAAVAKKRPAAKRPAAVAKKTSAAKKKKKTEPQGDEEAEESEEQSEPDECVEPAAEEGPADECVVPGIGYTVCFYKNGWQSALKRTHGPKKQICSLGGKRFKAVLNEAKLRAIAAELAEELVKGRVADTREAAKRAGDTMVHQAYVAHLKEKNASSHRSSSSSSPLPSPGPKLPFERGSPS